VYLAVRPRDLEETKSEQKWTCQRLFDSNAPKWAIKRFAKEMATEAKEERLIALHAKEEIASALRKFQKTDPALARELEGAARHVLTLDREVEDKENGTTALVYEYCNLGDLNRLLTKFKEQATPIFEHELINIALVSSALWPVGERCLQLACSHVAWLWMQQICAGLRLLKAAKVVHCDLYLRNVFLDWDPVLRQYCARIGDFGQCRDLGDTKTTKLRFVYSVHLAPEVDGKTVFNEQASSELYVCSLTARFV
jgi:serine/threonine protein kinase